MKQYDEDILKQLEVLGLAEVESIVYLRLLQTGPIRIGSITSDLKIDRNIAYRTLLKLRNKGLVVSTLSNPPLYVPINPEEAIHVILIRKEDDLLKIKKMSESIVGTLKKFRTKIEYREIPFHSIIQGRRNIYARMTNLIKQAKNTIYLVMPEEEFVRLYHSGIPDAIAQFIKKPKNKIFAVTTLDNPDSLEFITNVKTTETRIGKLPSRGIILLEEKNKLIFTGGFGDKKSMDNESMIYTNCPDLLANMLFLCKRLWETSKPIDPHNTTINLGNIVEKVLSEIGIDTLTAVRRSLLENFGVTLNSCIKQPENLKKVLNYLYGKRITESIIKSIEKAMQEHYDNESVKRFLNQIKSLH